jgi:hypothetical protein
MMTAVKVRWLRLGRSPERGHVSTPIGPDIGACPRLPRQNDLLLEHRTSFRSILEEISPFLKN